MNLPTEIKTKLIDMAWELTKSRQSSLLRPASKDTGLSDDEIDHIIKYFSNAYHSLRESIQQHKGN